MTFKDDIDPLQGRRECDNASFDEVVSSRLIELFKTPSLYPVYANWRRQTLRVIEMSRESYRDSAFLDWQRISRGRQAGWEVPIADLLEAGERVPVDFPSVHYIFHMGFCCSTLLSRYLESCAGCLVLREPHLFSQAAKRMIDVREPQVFRLLLRLLARRFGGDHLVVVKANDLCSRLAFEVLRRNPSATASILTVPLRVFLVHALLSAERRAWVHRRLRLIHRLAPGWTTAPDSMTDARAAVCWWLWNRSVFDRLRAAYTASRVVEIGADDVAERPEQPLRALSALCGSPFSEMDWRLAAASGIAHRYSKDPAQSYNAQSRRHQIGVFDMLLRAELDDAMHWASDHMQPSLAALGRSSPAP